MFKEVMGIFITLTIMLILGTKHRIRHNSHMGTVAISNNERLTFLTFQQIRLAVSASAFAMSDKNEREVLSG